MSDDYISGLYLRKHIYASYAVPIILELKSDILTAKDDSGTIFTVPINDVRVASTPFMNMSIKTPKKRYVLKGIRSVYAPAFSEQQKRQLGGSLNEPFLSITPWLDIFDQAGVLRRGSVRSYKTALLRIVLVLLVPTIAAIALIALTRLV